MRPRACNLPASGLALALVVAAARETQAREHARLRFTRAEGLDTCPTEEELRGAIVARLGYDPFDGEETAPLLRIRFVRRDRRFAALISRGEGDDTARTVESASCGELLAPTAIAISIAIDPLASPSPPETRAHAEAPPPPKAAPLPPAPAPAAPQPSGPDRSPTSPPWRLRLGLGAQVAVGTAPDAAALPAPRATRGVRSARGRRGARRRPGRRESLDCPDNNVCVDSNCKLGRGAFCSKSSDCASNVCYVAEGCR